MPAFGSSSKTGRLPSDNPRSAAGASSSSTGASSRTSSQASSRTRSTPVASTRKDRSRDVRESAGRASKQALGPATPSPSSYAPLTRTRVALLSGRESLPSVRSAEVSPALPPPSASAENKKATRLDEGVAAVRNLLFEEGPKTYCAVEEPSVSEGRGERSPHSSRVDAIDSIGAPSAPDGALVLASPAPSSSDRLAVDASIASRTRPAELRLADATWRRLAFRIARTGGARGDALAASVRTVLTRLAAALPPETESSARRDARGGGTLARRPEAASRLSHPEPLLLDAGTDAGSGERQRRGRRAPPSDVARAIDSRRSFVTSARRGAKRLRASDGRGRPTPARARAAVSAVARARLARPACLAACLACLAACLACLAAGAAPPSVVPLVARDVSARRRWPARAFERDVPPPS